MNIKFQTMREIVRDLFNVGETKEERREAITGFFNVELEKSI